MKIMVSPTEPPSLRAIADTVSMFPEKYGVDVIWRSAAQQGWVGVQRKEVGDLLSSVRDGRLGMQLRQMAPLKMCMVMIEGKIRWSTDGELLFQGQAGRGQAAGRPWTRKQLAGVLWSIQSKGAFLYFTESLVETVGAVQMFADWSCKDSHSGLDARSGPMGDSWGKVSRRDWQRHILMGLPGIGSELASRMLDHGGLPIGLAVTREELMAVPGLGKKKVDTIMEVLRND